MAGILQLTTGQVYLVGGSGTVALGTITYADGTVAAPSQAFTSETGSGLYRIGASNVGAAISGVLVFDWNASRVNFAQPLYLSNGTAALPSLVYGSDTTSGRYRLGASNVGEAIAGAAVYDWNATRLNTAIPIYVANGTVGAPSYVFANDTTSGRYRIGSNNLGESINGILTFDWNATRINSALPIYIPNGTNLLPTLTFGTQTDLGIYKISATRMAITGNAAGTIYDFDAGNGIFGISNSSVARLYLGAAVDMNLGRIAAGQLNLTANSGLTVGVGLDVSTDAILQVRTRAQSAFATVRALLYDTQTGGSTTIGAGVGSVKMTSANAATNAAWIPLSYNGTTYFCPAWTTNNP